MAVFSDDMQETVTNYSVENMHKTIKPKAVLILLPSIGKQEV